MTSESDQPSPEIPTPPSETTSGSDFGSPIGMVALGGMVLIVTYILFGLFLNDYWVSWLAMVLAISAIVLVRMDVSFLEKLASSSVLIKLIGYLLAIVGVLALVEDLRFANGTLNKFPDVVGALAAYAGYVIAFLGARSIKT